MPVIYTYWRHFQRCDEEEKSVVEALKRYDTDEGYGYASVESITLPGGKVLDSGEIYEYWTKHQELEDMGCKREQARLVALRGENSRPITWKEASALIRRLRWKPYVGNSHGVPILVANKWGNIVRIASASSLRRMTPVQFWERLRKIDPYRVAEVERNSF